VYGSRTDWLKNVLASGAAAIVHEGDTYPVGQPEIVPMESVRAYFPARIRRAQRLVRVDRCLRVRRVKAAKMFAAYGSCIGGRRGWVRLLSARPIGVAASGAGRIP